MTTLANANLLDDSVPNSGSLKSQRLNRTAQSATNPNPVAKVAKVQEEEFDEEDDYNEEYSRSDEPQRSYSSNKSNSKASVNSDADEKKIMGMNPALFYTLLSVGVLVGGYFAYTKFFKGKKKLPDAGIPATGGGTPEIKL